MFSKNKMVLSARKKLESMYKGKCNVIEHKKIKKKNGATGFADELVLQSQPCRLSFDSSPITQDKNGVSTKEQQITLFLSPEHIINSGSKIVVTQEGRCEVYKSSSVPKVYATHQEIDLELFEGWS